MRKRSSTLGLTVRELVATVLLISSSRIVPGVAAISFTPVPATNLDLSQLGRVALAGNFDSISLYQYEGQTQDGFSTNGSQSLLTRYPNGAFATLSSSDAYIESMCPFIRKDGTLAGVVVGGNFTSLGGVEAQGIALFNPRTSAVTPLPGLSGRVASVYCDDQTSTVYVGGSFTGGNSTNAIAWTTDWTNLPFAGFNGPVTSITKAPNGNIVFGGSFDGLGNVTTPKERDVQVIPVPSANITAGPSTLAAGFSDPRDIICRTSAQQGPGNTWLLADKTPGYWQANFRFGFIPTKLRLYNTNIDGRGTRTWRFTALPLNGILSFTYTGVNGEPASCSAHCPLPQDNTTHQDFHFAQPVGMNAFRIDILDWYGSGGGLSGIELFQDDIYSFAISEFNEPACDSVSSGGNSTAIGPWTETPSGSTNSAYLTAQLAGPNIQAQDAFVVFQPDIRQSGNYTITVFTPGCIQDATCTTRGRVNITGIMGSNGTRTATQPVTTMLYQTNNFDKYDQVYYGYVDATSDSFRPTVTLSPASGQNGPLTIVAQRVRFELVSSTGGLNGLFEFNPNRAVIDNDFSKSPVDQAGMQLNSGALINALAVQNNATFVGGNFTTSDFNNIFSIGGPTGNATSLPGGGLNSEVLTMFQNGSTLYVGGNFTNTRDNTVRGLNGVAAFSSSSNSWQPLGAGVNGVVEYIVPFTLNITANRPELVITVSGFFDQVLAFGSNASFPVSGLAVWVPSRNNWLHNLGLPTISIRGDLTAEVDVPGYPPLFAGAISSQGLAVSDAVALTSSGGVSLQPLPVNIQPQPQSSASTRKRAVSGQEVAGAVTGTIYDGNGLNITIIGGHFTATASNGSTVNNLLFINGTNSDRVTGVGNELNPNSVFLALGTQGTTLFAGGTISGTVNGNNINGLIQYDLAAANYAPTQPPALTGTNVAVNAIAPQPSSAAVFVGGNFDSAGSFSCPSICLYDTSRSQWSSPGAGLTGSVSAMTWVSNNQLIIGGNLTVGGSATTMATYNVQQRTFTEFSGASNVPGPVTALCPANDAGSQFWVAGVSTNGSAFLEKYDGSQWIPAGSTLGPGTTIRGLQIFSVTRNHASNNLVSPGQVLIVLGQLSLPNFGNASAALFNGTTFTPFILATSRNGAGSLSQAFVQNPQNFFKSSRRHLAVGFVVLIGLAIALALTFLLVVAGIIAERVRRKKEGYVPVPTQFDKNNNMNRIPPEHLFTSVGAGQGRAGAARL